MPKLWHLPRDLLAQVAVLKRCNCENCVRFLGVCIHEEGRLMLVTEYVARGDLWNAINCNNSSWGRDLAWYRRYDPQLDVLWDLCIKHTCSSHGDDHLEVLLSIGTSVRQTVCAVHTS